MNLNSSRQASIKLFRFLNTSWSVLVSSNSVHTQTRILNSKSNKKLSLFPRITTKNRYMSLGDQIMNNTNENSSASSSSDDKLNIQKSRNIVAESSYFDTHSFVKSLIQNGFTQQQAEQLCYLFKEIVNYIAKDIKKECVTKPGQDLAIQQVMIHIGSLKKDMIILEKSEFSTLRNENEKLVFELKALKEQLNDQMIKLKGGFALDINLEKSRSNEMTYEVTNRVHKLDSRIDTEISNVKALLEAFKADVIRYIAGSMFTAMVILLGALRYFAS